MNMNKLKTLGLLFVAAAALMAMLGAGTEIGRAHV